MVETDLALLLCVFYYGCTSNAHLTLKKEKLNLGKKVSLFQCIYSAYIHDTVKVKSGQYKSSIFTVTFKESGTIHFSLRCTHRLIVKMLYIENGLIKFEIKKIFTFFSWECEKTFCQYIWCASDIYQFQIQTVILLCYDEK